jgi:hypothetical protein
MSDQSAWGREAFLRRLFQRFPTLTDRPDMSAEGLVHCEMGWFSNKTSEAMEAHQFRLVRAHFEFIDEALARGSDELENAILVSYLENVFAVNTECTAKARDLLTPLLSAPVLEMEGHFIAHIAGTRPPIGRDCGTRDAEELEQRLLAMTKISGAAI